MANELPKISCLMVTANRLILLKQAVTCFVRQSYPNKELVIVTDGTAQYQQGITDFTNSLGRTDIKLVYLNPEGYTLGKLRNISLANAGGDLICQWDDDDLYHSERLQVQYDHLREENAGACFLGDQLHYFEQTQEMFWVDWIASNTIGERDQLFPGSLLAYNDSRFTYPENGSNAQTGEDTAYLYQLYQHMKVARLRRKGYVYVYRYHGQNSFSAAHHELIVSMHACGPEFAAAHELALRSALEQYDLPRPFKFKAKQSQPLFIYNH